MLLQERIYSYDLMQCQSSDGTVDVWFGCMILTKVETIKVEILKYLDKIQKPQLTPAKTKGTTRQKYLGTPAKIQKHPDNAQRDH